MGPIYGETPGQRTARDAADAEQRRQEDIAFRKQQDEIEARRRQAMDAETNRQNQATAAASTVTQRDKALSDSTAALTQQEAGNTTARDAAQAAAQGAQDRARTNLRFEANDRLLAQFPSLFALFNGPGGGASASGTVSGGLDAREGVDRAAALDRSTRQAGDIAGSSMAALNNALSTRGVSTDAPVATRAAADLVSQGGNPVGEINRESAIQDASRAHDVSNIRASAALTDRARNFGVAQSMLSLLNGPLY